MLNSLARFIRLCAIAVIFAAIGTNQSVSADKPELPAKLEGHGGPIKAITIAPDGKRVLTASFDYSVILWNISKTEAEVVHRLIGHDNSVNDVEFLSDGKRAVSVSDDGSLGVWDLDEGKLITRIISTEHKALDVAVSPNGKLAAASKWDGTARIYDLETLTETTVLDGHRGNVNASVFSADSTKLYTASYDGSVLEWDVKTGDQLRPIYRHGWGLNTIERLDDDRLAFGSVDGSVVLVSIEAADRIADLARSQSPIQSIKISQDRSWVAYGDAAGDIGIFEANTGNEIQIAPVTHGPVWDFDFVGNTNQLYHVGLDDFAAKWQILPVKLGQIVAQQPRRFQVRNTEDRGALEFQRKCSVCHTLTPDGENRAGPTLYNVFGREAGTLQGYPYSEALLDSKIIWNENTINALFRDGPDIVTPGTKMPIQRLKRVTRREDLIRYLKQATAPR